MSIISRQQSLGEEALAHRLELWNCVFGGHIQKYDPGLIQADSRFFQLPPEFRDQIYFASFDIKADERNDSFTI